MKSLQSVVHENFSTYLQDLAYRKLKNRPLEVRDDVLRRMFGFIDFETGEIVEVSLKAVHQVTQDAFQEASMLFGLKPDKLKRMMAYNEDRKRLVENLPVQG